MNGLIFDIKEFSIRDGEGVRTTVFFKGCPLRCAWCHNPEGLSPTPELWADAARCRNCGLCRIPCEHTDCKPFGRCLHVCPQDLVRRVGKTYTVPELAARLRRQKPMFDAMGGGVTLSGGEPLLQVDFCAELLKELGGDIHITVETSGYASERDFERIIHLCNFVIMDIKLMNDEAHRHYTGVSNAQILSNAKLLMRSGVPHLFRTPLIPSITDTEENLRAIAEFLGDEPIELLTYNDLAPAKYAAVSRTFSSEIDPSKKRTPDLSFFKNATLRS